MKHTLDTRNQSLSIEIPGDMLSTNVEILRQEIFAILDTDMIRLGSWTILALDLTHAEMIDSMGLNLLVDVIKHVQQRGARITATLTNPQVHRTLLFTRLNRYMDIIEREPQPVPA